MDGSYPSSHKKKQKIPWHVTACDWHSWPQLVQMQCDILSHLLPYMTGSLCTSEVSAPGTLGLKWKTALNSTIHPHLDSPTAFLFLSTSSELKLSHSDLHHLFTLETRRHGLQTHVRLQGGKGQNTISVPLPKPKNDWVRHQKDNKDGWTSH